MKDNRKLLNQYRRQTAAKEIIALRDVLLKLQSDQQAEDEYAMNCSSDDEKSDSVKAFCLQGDAIDGIRKAIESLERIGVNNV